MGYLFLLGAIIAEVSATLSLRMAATGVRAYYAAVAGGASWPSRFSPSPLMRAWASVSLTASGQRPELP